MDIGMGWKKKLVRGYRKFVLGRFVRTIAAGSLRPFFVDAEGVWFPTKHGFSVLCNFEDRILELDVNPVWEAMETAFVLDNVRPGDVFIDVGANIGYFSMLAAQRQPSQVLAVEPVGRTFDVLARNVRHNGLGGVIHPLNVALGSHASTVRLVSTRGPKNHVEYAVGGNDRDLEKVEASLTTLDSLLKSPGSPARVDFIKVDIEGYEYEFLKGARETIARFKPMMLMEVEQHRLEKFGVQASDVFGFLAELGYRHLCVREDVVAPGGVLEEDLTKGRDFVFYTAAHRPVY
jgi:FkbM family methyltransferase